MTPEEFAARNQSASPRPKQLTVALFLKNACCKTHHQRNSSLVHLLHIEPTKPPTPFFLLLQYILQWDIQLLLLFHSWSNCEGGGDVVGVVTPLVGGVAQVLHGDQVVELSVQLEVQEVEGKEEDREGQVEVEEEKVELKEKRT